MTTPPTDWLMPAAILLAGVIAGLFFLFGVRRREALDEERDVELRDLQARRDGLLAQLRELDDTAGKMTPEQMSAQRARLEQDAAQTLRAIDERTAARPVASTKTVHRPAMSPAERAATRRGFLWGSLSTGAVAFLIWFVAASMTQRSEKDGLTGTVPGPASAMQPAQADPALQQLETSLRSRPDDLDLRMELAKAYIERENLMAAFEQTKFVLERSPSDARALTYQGLIRMSMGERETALQMLERATQSDPGFLDGWVTLAWVQVQSGDDEKAGRTIDEAIRRHPQEEARLREVLQRMRAQVTAPSTPPAPAGPGVRVTIDIDDSARSRVPAGAVLFVIARGAGVTTGPPVAVKRVPVSTFPINVELTSADSMMGQPFPQSLRVEARLDADGVATTRANEPSAAEDGVVLGGTVSLRLK